MHAISELRHGIKGIYGHLEASKAQLAAAGIKVQHEPWIYQRPSQKRPHLCWFSGCQQAILGPGGCGHPGPLFQGFLFRCQRGLACQGAQKAEALQVVHLQKSSTKGCTGCSRSLQRSSLAGSLYRVSTEARFSIRRSLSRKDGLGLKLTAQMPQPAPPCIMPGLVLPERSEGANSDCSAQRESQDELQAVLAPDGLVLGSAQQGPGPLEPTAYAACCQHRKRLSNHHSSRKAATRATATILMAWGLLPRLAGL